VWLKIRSRDGVVADTISEPVWPRKQPTVSATAPGRPSPTEYPVPFTAAPIATISPLGYLVSGIGDHYAVELHQGTLLVSIRRTVQAERVSEKERNDERSRIEGYLRAIDPLWTWGRASVPATKPYYTSMLVALDGRIWLTREMQTTPRITTIPAAAVGAGARGPRTASRPRSVVASGPERAGVHDILDPSGAFVGQVSVPPRVFVVTARGDSVWAIAYGEDDVPSVKRYRIAWWRNRGDL
jgi:hypothetical protein